MYLAGRLAHGIHGKGDGRWEEKENDNENENENERGRKIGPRNTRNTRNGGREVGGERERLRERGTRNDFFWGGRAAGAEMAGREPLSRGAGDGGK